jgi:hypothetical protein
VWWTSVQAPPPDPFPGAIPGDYIIVILADVTLPGHGDIYLVT